MSIQNSNSGALVTRLEQFLNTKNVSIQQLADMLGYASPQKIYRLFNTPGACPSIHIIEDISNKYPELSLNWLFTGVGKATLATTLTSKTNPKIVVDLIKKENEEGESCWWIYKNNSLEEVHDNLEKATARFERLVKYYQTPLTPEVIQSTTIIPQSVQDFASALGEELAGL